MKNLKLPILSRVLNRHPKFREAAERIWKRNKEKATQDALQDSLLSYPGDAADWARARELYNDERNKLGSSGQSATKNAPLFPVAR